MSDLTPGDLFGDELGESDDGGSDGKDTGEWALKLYDRLDKDGRLDALLFGGEPRSMDEISAEQQPEQQPQQQAVPDGGGGSGGGAELDADGIKKVMLKVYDNAEMIPGLSDDPTLSEMIQLVDAKPGVVNQLIQEHI